MRFGQVIGRVTLSQYDPSFKGGRYLVVLPWLPPRGHHVVAPRDSLAKGNSLVVYDNLGAGVGDIIGYSESGEAAAAFAEPTPVDAYNCAILDSTSYNPPVPEAAKQTDKTPKLQPA